MAVYESGEMYLEAIFRLTIKKQGVHAIDVADAMHFSKPSVSRALARLREEEMIVIDGEDHIILTEAGRSRAEKIYDRHVVLSNLLIGLGVSEETATADACKMEHDISDESFAAIKEYIRRTGKTSSGDRPDIS